MGHAELLGDVRDQGAREGIRRCWQRCARYQTEAKRWEVESAGAAYSWQHAWPAIWNLVSELCWQRHVYQWALDHRVHHKYSETNADPHDARRGFLFSHIGWLVLTPHPEVEEKRKAIDMSDLEADPIVMWQKR